MVSNASEIPVVRPPRIGVTTYRERARYGVWDQDSAVLPGTYLDAVVQAGGVPVLLPPVGDAFEVLVDGIDGLLLSGGADIGPSTYGEPAHELTDVPRDDRDAFEFGLLRVALAAGLPVLGVCRGCELLNVAFGGTLTQHLPDAVGHDRHRPRPAEFGVSRIALDPASTVGGALGATGTEISRAGTERLSSPPAYEAQGGGEVKVRCYHHQAIGRLAPGLTATGWADDGTVEAVELLGAEFVLGVQWHPEESPEDPRLMRAFVRAATRWRDR